MTPAESTSVPGFVDLQVNGYLGVDFSSPTLGAQEAETACGELLRSGTAAILPTLITCPVAVYRRNLSLISEVMESSEFEGRLLGIHVEGPFLSGEAGFVGAHDPGLVLEPDTALLEQMQEWARGKIRLLTIAAELPGAADLTRCARGLGMAVSVGHSNCTGADLARVADAGAVAITHLGNGLPPELPRHPNPMWAGLAEDRLAAAVIADGHHLPDSVLRVTLRTKGVRGTVVVSDLSPIAGLPPGEHICFGNRVVLEESGRVSLPERGCLAASAVPMMQSMNRLAALGELSLEDLLAVGFHNPLRLLGLSPGDVKGTGTLDFDRERSQFTLRDGAG